MNQWYYEIKHYSHRDQLSFNYVLWKLNNKYVKYIPKIFIYDYKISYIQKYVINN